MNEPENSELPVKSIVYFSIVGLLTLLGMTAAGSWVILLLTISVIGIPVALLILAAPTLLIFSLLRAAASVALGMYGYRSWLLSAMIAIAALSVVPLYENYRIERAARQFLAEDHNSIGKVPPTDTLAFIKESYHYNKGHCLDLCQRALLNGVVQKIIIVDNGGLPSSTNRNMSGMQYRLEKRQSCPEVKVPNHVAVVHLPSERGRQQAARSPQKQMQLQAALGQCLVAEPDTPVDTADALIYWGAALATDNRGSAWRRGFHGAFRAKRLAFYLRQNGKFVEKYRSTGLNYNRLLPVFAPRSNSGSKKGAPKWGYYRWNIVKGLRSRRSLSVALEPLVLDTLKWDLALKDNDTDEVIRKLINRKLDAQQPLDANTNKTITQFLHSWRRDGRDMPRQYAVLTARILASKNVDLVKIAEPPIWQLLAAHGDLADEVAKGLFERLPKAMSIYPSESPSHRHHRLQRLALMIKALPDNAVLPYRHQMGLLAMDPATYYSTRYAFKKFAVFGADAVPDLLRLIGTATGPHVATTTTSAKWPKIVGSALEALCLMETSGELAIQPLFDLMDKGTIPKGDTTIHLLTIKTLASLGADSESIWLHSKAAKTNLSRGSVDAAVATRDNKSGCKYSNHH